MTSTPDPQRRLIAALLASALLAPTSRSFAADFPQKPVRLVVPFPPGGIADAIARGLASHFQLSTGQTLLVDNRAGGGGIIAADAVAKAAPDGYTLLLAAIGQAVVNPLIMTKLPYDPKVDLIPITLIAQGPNVLIVNAASPYRSLNDLINAAKADPGTLTFGTYGNGSSPHLAAALLSQRTGARFIHIPYKGAAPAMTDLLGGQTSFMFDSLITSLQQLKSGKIRALAVTSGKRHPLIPEVPTLAEVGIPNFTMQAWYGLHAPGKTPVDRVMRLNRAVAAFCDTPAMRKQFADQGLELVSGSPDDYARLLDSEDKKWGAIIKEANITVD